MLDEASNEPEMSCPEEQHNPTPHKKERSPWSRSPDCTKPTEQLVGRYKVWGMRAEGLTQEAIAGVLNISSRRPSVISFSKSMP